MHARYTVLHAAQMHESVGEIDLIPREGAELSDAQAMPKGNQDHGRVTQAVAAPSLLGDRDQVFQLRRRGGGTVPFRRVGRALR
jgi:hypothetical protein